MFPVTNKELEFNVHFYLAHNFPVPMKTHHNNQILSDLRIANATVTQKIFDPKPALSTNETSFVYA